MGESIPRYGVHRQTRSETAVDRAIEAIGLVGYAVVPGNYGLDEMAHFSAAFDRALAETHARFGRDELVRIDEHLTIRAPLSTDRLFLELALNPAVIAVCSRLMGEYLVLNQQNGIVNPPNAQRYNQGAFHRDLPYQHFVSSRPLALNALFCLDPFTEQNGATHVVPASHKSEAFPSDAAIGMLQKQVVAEAGSFIILDCMVFHSGGVNRTGSPRRAVNHVYSVPFIRQQIDLPSLLGPGYIDDPGIRRFLGYDVRSPADLAAYYATRQPPAAEP
jgi:ectoine hydroxylase-related dioxygenase (phytanoyl-CoA dioxygenase family)